MTNHHNEPDFGVFLPSKREIRRECERIQAGWTAQEHERRSCSRPLPVEVQTVSVDALQWAVREAREEIA